MSRIPFVTIALVLAMLAGMLTVGQRLGDGGERARATLVAAVDYFEAHPYVEPGPGFAAWLGEARIREAREAFEASGMPTPQRFARAEAQDEWDAMAARALAALADLPSKRHGVQGANTPPANLFTHAFLHLGWASLAVSLVFLLIAGPLLEIGVGHLAYTFVCVSLIAGSGLLHANLYPDATQPWLGSSAFLAGLLGAYLVLAFGRGGIPGLVLLPAWGLAEYLGARGLRIDDLGTMDTTPPVMHATAIVVGIGLALFLRAFGTGRQKVREAVAEKAALSNPVLERAMRAREAGQEEQARAWLRAAWSADPGDLDVALAYWDVARHSGAAQEAMPAALSVVRQALESGQTARALSHWSEIASDASCVEGDPRLMVRIGEILAGDGQLTQAALAMQVALDNAPSPALGLCIVQVMRESHPQIAAGGAVVALGDPALPGPRRAELEAMCAAAEQAAKPVAVELPPEPVAAATPATPAPVTEFDDNPVSDPDALSPDHLAAASPGAPGVEADTDAAPEQWNLVGVVDGLGDESEGALDLDAPAAPGAAQSAADLMPALDLSQDAQDTEPDAPEIEAELDADSLALSLAGRVLQRVEAVPVSLATDGLSIQTKKGQSQLPFTSIEAIAVAAVEGIGTRPVLLIDLALNWLALADEPLRVVRLRSDRIEARALFPDAANLPEALRRLSAAILEGSGATPLPDENAVCGRPFARFASLQAYETEVLGASAE